jgi:hypothetical protein
MALKKVPIFLRHRAYSVRISKHILTNTYIYVHIYVYIHMKYEYIYIHIYIY